MGQDVTNQTRFCQIPQGSKKGLSWHRKSRRIFMAVGLSFILTTSFVYYLMIPSPPLSTQSTSLVPLQLTLPEGIVIIGDADFLATALIEGWPGDGSPENPIIIDGLKIDLSAGGKNCIVIRHTRVSFRISNCILTMARPLGWYYHEAGIYLQNVTNGQLLNNIVDKNYNGIILHDSDYNTIAYNTCSNNTNNGIILERSDFNTVVNNTCSSNGEFGINLQESNSNIVANNTCNNNTSTPGDHVGIYIQASDYNTVANNTCKYNRIGIYLYSSDSNYVYNNSCLGNFEHEIYVDSDPENSSLILL
ncbi:MAG: nitrous oxide reductase family maturation protein NosD [Candidatus Sifarchaeia archaeon]